ncbi:hypothetical protein [Chloroflexus sp.]|uniref:hypothetical protein n=1 Tax=Chloroflexus sp. TaxID=1904827 RepID=UPI002ACDF881|nr:hypothetical protein [Chloroflexus sp.]
MQTVDRYAGQFLSQALDQQGHPHLAYYDSANADLKYAYWDGAGWVIHVVDETDITAWYVTLALDSFDQPHIGYYNASQASVQYTFWNGAAWQRQIVISANNAIRALSLDLDADNQPQLSLFTEHSWDQNALWYARPSNGFWQIELSNNPGRLAVTPHWPLIVPSIRI